MGLSGSYAQRIGETIRRDINVIPQIATPRTPPPHASALLPSNVRSISTINCLWPRKTSPICIRHILHPLPRGALLHTLLLPTRVGDQGPLPPAHEPPASAHDSPLSPTVLPRRPKCTPPSAEQRRPSPKTLPACALVVCASFGGPQLTARNCTAARSQPITWTPCVRFQTGRLQATRTSSLRRGMRLTHVCAPGLAADSCRWARLSRTAWGSSGGVGGFIAAHDGCFCPAHDAS